MAELICSNSLGLMRITRAQGLLKEELKLLDCELLKIAQECAVPVGTALTVDRQCFASKVTRRIKEHPLIDVVREEVTKIPDGVVILASGPLTFDALAASLKKFCGEDFLYFYDAVAPIVSRESLDSAKLVQASRYDAGEAGFLNAFMDKDGYLRFYNELINAEQHPLHEVDKDREFFEGCLPIEEIARRGEKSPLEFPQETMLGALRTRLAGNGEYASLADRFTPIKPIFALLPSLSPEPKGKEVRRRVYAERSLEALRGFPKSLD